MQEPKNHKERKNPYTKMPAFFELLIEQDKSNTVYNRRKKCGLKAIGNIS